MAGTFEQLTADTILAPFLMIAECSALVPTMKPVTLCRKMTGVLLIIISSVAVVQKWECVLRLIAKPDELGALRRFVTVDHGDSVGDYTHLMSCMYVSEELISHM